MQKVKEFVTSRPFVQEILKDVFQQKEKLCQIEIWSYVKKSGNAYL